MTTGITSFEGHAPIVSVSQLPSAESLHSAMLCVATLGVSQGLKFETAEQAAHFACETLGLRVAALNRKFGPRGLCLSERTNA